MIRSPLEQFRLNKILEINVLNNNIIIVTEIIIYVIIGIIILIILEREGRKLGISKKKVIKEVKKGIIEKIVLTIIGGKEKYVVIINTILMSILIYNIIGLVPYNKTITAELILSMTISISLVIGITLIGIKRNGIKILKILIPNNTPILLVTLLVLIETISYIARGISLGLRLGANMIAGHTLLKIIITFIYVFINMDISKEIIITWKNNIINKYKESINILTFNKLEGIKGEIIKEVKEMESIIRINYGKIMKGIIIIGPIGLLIMIVVLEIGVSIMQALVFTIILGIYIEDVDYDIK